MKSFVNISKLMLASLIAFVVVTGCESTDDGGATVHVGAYYGVGFYDPWYYGGVYYPPDAIEPPPRPTRPVEPPRPEHPIARPPSAPAPRPMPSIPSAPRPVSRGGGRR